MIINVWGRTLWWCKLAKAALRFAKRHQLMMCLISFTHGKTFPGLQGRPGCGAGGNNTHGCAGGAGLHEAPASRFAEQPKPS